MLVRIQFRAVAPHGHAIALCPPYTFARAQTRTEVEVLEAIQAGTADSELLIRRRRLEIRRPTWWLVPAGGEFGSVIREERRGRESMTRVAVCFCLLEDTHRWQR